MSELLITAAAGVGAGAGCAFAATSVLLNRAQARVEAMGRALARARYEATHDELTGLVNRAGLLAHLAELESSDESYAVMVLDLNGFKTINDTYGHQAGDDVLGVLGDRLNSFVDGAGLAGRLGGDEFVLVIPSVSAERSTGMAHTVVMLLAQGVELDTTTVFVTASVGLVHAERGSCPAELLHAADLAMYEAKWDGREVVAAAGPAPVVPRPRQRLRERVAARVLSGVAR